MALQRPSRRSVALACAAVAGITCAAGSPAVMLAMDRWLQVDWPRLSNIGQAYGLASAIFSVLAVVGVAVSLAHQSHGVVVQRDQDISDAHARLLSLVLTDPETFGRCSATRRNDSASSNTSAMYLSRWYYALRYPATKPATPMSTRCGTRSSAVFFFSGR